MAAVENKKTDFFKLFDTFLKETEKGKRVQKNGKRVRDSSIKPYVYLRKLLFDFSVKKNFALQIYSVSSLKKRKLQVEKNYWARFYAEFTNYLYNDCDCYDNYVGSNIKRLRAFFNYLNEEKNMSVGNFHKKFYAHHEDIEIITLIPEQLNFLIYNKAFEATLPDHLKKTKDMFVFGCTVALRVSDIFKLSKNNIESLNGKFYLKVRSQKTNTLTRILLPDYAMDIINKYNKNQKTIFPEISNARFNLNIKSLIERTHWTDEQIKTRQKRGQTFMVYKNEKTKELYRFCDLITSHTMRRTAITTMLCLHMPENLVRKISGHAAGSKEFFRYVELSQKYMDNETEKVHDQIKNKELVY
ncbi:MAG: tyrosine-type recombinase/integrase [Bacteroidota bacterium]